MTKTETRPSLISGFSVSCCGYCEIEGSVGYIGNLWRKILEKKRRKGRNREKIEETENQTGVSDDRNKKRMVNEVEDKGH